MRALATVALCSCLAGCYLAHERDPVRERSDAAAVDGGIRAADAALADTIVAPDAATSCGPAIVVEVPEGGCVATTFASTEGNACGFGAGAFRTSVHVRRPSGGRPWYFLIRSRDHAAVRLAAGLADLASCTCREQASVSGGDLTVSGVGGDLPTMGAEVDLVLDGDQRAMWLRMCDGPPR